MLIPPDAEALWSRLCLLAILEAAISRETSFSCLRPSPLTFAARRFLPIDQ